ncbi:MAG: TfoX/Sxy family protein [Bacteroidales bacterium]|nr:TfoX/Sxy family protein [Bacteroidales bacterium]
MKPTDEYAGFILDKLAALEVVSGKRMFGGWVIHMAGKVLGFVFEDTFLFEPGPTVDRMLPDAPRRELFPGSKLFVVIDESMNSHRLCELARACYDDFPISKPRKRRGKAAEQEEKRRKEIEERFPFAKNIE